MKTLIASDVAIWECGGRYYYATQVSTILKRYYQAFGTLSVCCRVNRADTISGTYEDVTGMIGQVVELPSLQKTMLGFYQQKIRAAVAQSDLVICRCPGIAAYRAADAARKCGKPYFTESMGCAWDAYWNHGIVGKVIAPYMFFKMKYTVYHADYALYVTSEFLQNRYPCKNESIAASNVKIGQPSEAVLAARLQKIQSMDANVLTLMTTAAVDVRYKGQEYVIRAIPQLNKVGIRVRYVLVGGGDPGYLTGLAQSLGVSDQVVFAGRKPLEEVFHLLDDADIYIQPSLQEGLPRSVIEAMSRGCICVGARTAGIPELLEYEYVVKRKSASDICKVIQRIHDAPVSEKQANARRNFEMSGEFDSHILDARRDAYYQKITAQVQTT